MESSELTSSIPTDVSKAETGKEDTEGSKTVETVGQADPETAVFYETVTAQLDGLTVIMQFIVFGIFACLGAKLAQGFSFWKW